MTDIGTTSVPRPAARVFRALLPLLALGACAPAAGVESPPPAPVKAAAPDAGPGPAPAADRIRVLFLGDNGHHRPTARAKSVLPVLAHNGIDLFYTDDPDDLSPEVLRQYHTLVFYNNQPRISRAQLAALTGFLKNGGGLVVLHSASASFQNSEEFIRIVGAAFKSHGTGVFRAKRLVPDHPVLRGVPNFETWDETYVHTKHNPDRTVLEVRVQDGHEEPYTWVRTYSAGRIFYTAWGHDQRTWENEGFQQLLTQAIKWTAGDWAFNLKAAEPTPATTKLEVPIPLYERPPAPWNTLAGFVDTAQVPLSPEESIALTTVRPGFRLELFAAEPLIRNIIDFTWDARGRLWAIESVDYPNVVLPDGERGNDRVLILEDTDGDGRADRTTVFADGLNLATSLVFANGGLIVAQPPHIFFFRDTDGDDHADEKRILFSGWPRDDTHGSVSNLRYGFDNNVWGSVGYNGFRGTVGGVKFGRGSDAILMGAGYFRFAPDGSFLDYVARTSNNTWGVGLSEDGYVFGSTANRNASNFVHIPGRYYRELIGRTPTLRTIADRQDVFPLRPIFQVDQFGMYTAGAAHEIYTARAFPREYWNRIAFVAAPTAHAVGMFELTPAGSGYRAENRWSFIVSRDAWQSPIQVKVGPDGAVWVSDFYSLVVQHNPTPEGMERGPGNAYETPNRDKERSRIYRVVYEGAPPPRITRLDDATPAELVAALRDDNMFWRFTAQRLLVERGETDVVPALIELVNDNTVDELGLNPGALHALWTLEGLGAIESDPRALEAARRALHHPAASLRRAALMVLPRDARLLDDIFAAGILPDRTSPHEVDYTVGTGVLQDADPHVRVTALLTLAELPPTPRAATAIVELITAPGNARDPWLPDAAAIAGVKQGPDVALALLRHRPPARLARDSAYLAGLERAVELMTYHFAMKQNADAVLALLHATPDANPSVAAGVLTGIAGGPVDDEGRQRGGRGGWPEGSPPTLTAEQRAALAETARRAPAELADGFARVAERWGLQDLFAARNDR
ncbi:MAG TPA: PVC-type heme-binding CxxCH protein [Longimicrobiales bacterium]